MKLQIRVDENGIISDVKFKTFGCGSAIASSSYMTERVKGLSLEEAEKIKNTEIAKELCLPPVKLHCSSMSNIHKLIAAVLLKCPPLLQCSLRTLSGQPSATTTASVQRCPTPRRQLASSTFPSQQRQARRLPPHIQDKHKP